MKMIVFMEDQSPTINFGEIDDNSIVGYMINGAKYEVVYFKGEFGGIGGTNNGCNTHHTNSCRSMRDFISESLRHGSILYAFDTRKELYKWLSE